MNPERFREARKVVDVALDRRESDRSAFVRETCSGKDTLRAEVDSLLAASDAVREHDFLGAPAEFSESAASGPLEVDWLEAPLPAAYPAGASQGPRGPQQVGGG